MTAAFELTATPALRAAYDVTVYQMGWRLGGKGASGRNAAQGQRIEEHGLHVWFGFYDNAFDLMRRCYDELARPAGAPLATFDEAFTPCDEIVLGEQYDDTWLLHTYNVPRIPLEPGTEGVLPTLWELVERGLDWAASEFAALAADLDRMVGVKPKHPHWPGLVRRVAEKIGERLISAESVGHAELLDWTRRLCRDLLASPQDHHERAALLCDTLRDFKNALWTFYVHDHLAEDGLRNFFMNVDLFTSMLVGIIGDDVLGNGFGPLDDEELRAWLHRHGMKQYSLDNSPVLRGFYSGGFAFEGGDIDKPNVAAGTAVHAVLRIFTYKDSILRKMQAGMGDTVFTPMYEAMKQRGVKFEFFRRVDHLGLSEDGTQIASVDVIHQAEVDGPAEYRPLVPVRGLDCWPSDPDWSQLIDGDALRSSGINFEYGQDAPGALRQTLRAGVDFDHVVLAIPVAALPAICGELVANQRTPEFADMVDHTATTMTQAFQLWTNETASTLGWAHRDDSILTAYVEPIDTYADMTHLLDREDWDPKLGVANIAYYCGVLDDRPGETQQQATDRAYAAAVAWIDDDMSPVWTASDDGGRGPFDWNALVDASGATGAARMRAQYWRANLQPTERYTLSLAGTMKYRLAADESGYANLVLAGDWIRNGIDAGCVEATVMSGMQAARAICGSPDVIVGEDRNWLEGPRS
jgi:uncharacterized protein with NAD-binding domain and iron-sulfur cluster